MRNLVFLCFPLCAQTIDFEKNHLGPNEVIGERIQMGDFFIQANEIMATNYGANFDVDGISLYCYYGFRNTLPNEIILGHINNNAFQVYSISAYQVSEHSTDTLIIQGWLNNNKVYENKYYEVYSWQTLELNYRNITKLAIRSQGTYLDDYNFDNFVIFIDIIQPKLINGELK